jgi:hypothetical protein
MNDSISTSSEKNLSNSFIFYKPRQKVKIIQDVAQTSHGVSLTSSKHPLRGFGKAETCLLPTELKEATNYKKASKVGFLVIKPVALPIKRKSVDFFAASVTRFCDYGRKSAFQKKSSSPTPGLIATTQKTIFFEKSLKTKKLLDWVCYSQSQYSAKRNEELLPEDISVSIEPIAFPSVIAEASDGSSGAGRNTPAEHGLLRPEATIERMVSDTLFERQNILQCYKERNLLRLFIAFCDFQAKEVNDRRARLLKGSVQQASESEKKVTLGLSNNKNTSIEKSSHPSDKKSSSRYNRALPASPEEIAPAKQRLLRFILAGRKSVAPLFISAVPNDRLLRVLNSVGKTIQKFRQFSKQLFRESSGQILIQILIIPYTFIFGIFYTFTSFQLSSTLTSKDYSTTATLHPNKTGSSVSLFRFGAFPSGEAVKETSQVGVVGIDSTEIIASGLFAPRLNRNQACKAGLAEIESYSPLSLLYSYSIQFHSLPEELLRLSHFSSKIFILWGFLNIWKGVRPAKSTRNEYVIQTRLLISRKNKKRFSDIEGIEKFLPVLKTLVESFQANHSNSLPHFAASNAVGRQSSFGNLGRGKSSPGASGLRLLEALLSKKRLISSASSNRLLPRAEGGRSFASSCLLTHPKGYLFIGPPGTGKTLLAQAVAGEAKVNLICLSASEIQKQIDIGTRIGAIRLRNLFEQARKNTPCILFLDEIDAIGRARNESMDLKLFTEFLIQMDSFSIKNGFIVIGTTNFLSSLDSAFVRSGRFDRIIGLNYPGKQTRIDILKLYTKRQGFDPSISWNYFGEITKGFSAADLSKVVNESSLYLIETKFIATNSASSDVSSLQSSSESSGFVLPASTEEKTVGSISTTSLTPELLSYKKIPTNNKESEAFSLSLGIVTHGKLWLLSLIKPQWVKDRLVHTSFSLQRGIQRISNHN